MQKILQWLEKVLMTPMAKASEQRHLVAIRDGIIATLPLIIVGSFFTLFASPPIPYLADLVQPHAEKIMIANRMTLGLMALYASFCMGYNLSKSYKMDGLSGGLLSLATFLMMNIPLNLDDKLAKKDAVGYVLPMADLGGSGLFVAIISMIFAVEISRLVIKSGFTIKMPEQVPSSVARSFESLIPATLVIIISWFIRVILNIDLNKIVNMLFEPLGKFAGDSLLGALIPVFFIVLLWAAGIHGVAVMGAVFQPIWFSLLDQNIDAKAAGEQLPNIVVEPFFQWFVWIGGAGATLSLCILMVFSKSEYLKKVGRFSIIPSIFNINEPLIFGTPLVMNPILALPFIFIPLVLTTITYFVFKLGLIAKITILAPWTLPGPIGALFATNGDWKALILVLINLLIAIVLYYPFFKKYEREMLAQEQSLNEDSAEKE
ncbi:PTS sugar transporter subunit IIC [Staphylococcus haemolyticus]|uniref:PTS sugar transporter subunit IIC n=1 Tax=Staphylococcus haemolyticus TaxID=1283 RepID=UPI00187AF268|nr:PTS sugar transporter subunit IIC [Staphylococcus haemolyticus]MBE7340367.1 PTS sugar transporter subunit IIC [Staphylococcus haemolyticus]